MKYLPLVLTGLGLILEVRGAYLGSRSFQVFTFWLFLRRSIWLSITQFFSFKHELVLTDAEKKMAAKKAEIFEQKHLDAKYIFSGLAFLFVGFLLQAIAVLIQLVDAYSGQPVTVGPKRP